jgi:hypothetical protein
MGWQGLENIFIRTEGLIPKSTFIDLRGGDL